MANGDSSCTTSPGRSPGAVPLVRSLQGLSRTTAQRRTWRSPFRTSLSSYRQSSGKEIASRLAAGGAGWPRERPPEMHRILLGFVIAERPCRCSCGCEKRRCRPVRASLQSSGPYPPRGGNEAPQEQRSVWCRLGNWERGRALGDRGRQAHPGRGDAGAVPGALLPGLLCPHRRQGRPAADAAEPRPPQAELQRVRQRPLAGEPLGAEALPPRRLCEAPPVGLLRPPDRRRGPRVQGPRLRPGHRRRHPRRRLRQVPQPLGHAHGRILEHALPPPPPVLAGDQGGEAARQASVDRLRGDLSITPPPQSVFCTNAVGGRAALRSDRGNR